MIDVHNTFSPGQEIIHPEQFAGRKENISRAIRALCRNGTSLLVYGERGVGKSSFTEMVKLIAQGQVELMYRYGLRSLKPKGGFRYQVVSIECDGDVETSEDVLQRLLTSPEGLSKLISGRIAKVEESQKETVGVSLLKRMFSYSKTHDEKITLEKFSEESIFELFTNVVLAISQNLLEQNEGLLISIDEFDRVKEKTKISSLIKTLSKNKVKFLISGIAENYFDLIDDHASVERQLFQGKIEIKPMNEAEIIMLFNLAQKHNSDKIKFQSNLIREIETKSFGFPYYVQLFGQLALDRYVEIHGVEKHGQILSEHLKVGLKNFASSEPKLERIYQSIIGTDPGKEIMLKGLANLISKEIRQSEVFRYCEKRGVSEPKRTLASLLSFKDPEVLIRIDKERVTFNDSLFRIFAGSCEPRMLKNDKVLGLTIASS